MITFFNDNRISKIDTHGVTLLMLRSFLDENEPKLVYFLQNLWNSQRKAITYKELREAILSGELPVELLEEWQQDYSKFLLLYLKPLWIKAMETANRHIENRYGKFFFDPMNDGVQQWLQSYGAAFVTNSSQTQLDALNAVIQMATRLEDYSVDELSKAIRPIVGLNHPQALANLRYYQTMREYGLSEKKARDKSIRYANRQHRARGYLIARTELAFAYNKGEYLGIKQAQEKGILGQMEKVWCTADDERVCNTCGPMEGKRIPLDELFDYETKLDDFTRITPPLHPNCRCGLLYEEVEPPQPTFLEITF